MADSGKVPRYGGVGRVTIPDSNVSLVQSWDTLSAGLEDLEPDFSSFFRKASSTAEGSLTRQRSILNGPFSDDTVTD